MPRGVAAAMRDRPCNGYLRCLCHHPGPCSAPPPPGSLTSSFWAGTGEGHQTLEDAAVRGSAYLEAADATAHAMAAPGVLTSAISLVSGAIRLADPRAESSERITRPDDGRVE